MDKWNEFWFRRVSSYSLSLIRCFLGFVVFYKVSGKSVKKLFLFYDSWRWPYPGFSWIPVPTAEFSVYLKICLVVSSMLMIVGFLTRLVVPLIALIFTYLNGVTQFAFHHHTFLLIMVLWILCFSRCNEYLSVDSRLFGGERPKKGTSILPIRFFQCLVTALYFFTTLSKFHYGWFSGRFVKNFLKTKTLSGKFLRFLVPSWLLGTGTVLAEGFLAFAFWFSNLKKFAFLVGFGLHFFVGAAMNIITFSSLMVALYIAFLNPAPRATVVLYDERCSSCALFRYIVEKLDWFARLTWIDFADPSKSSLMFHLGLNEPKAAIHAITPDGKIWKGAGGLYAILCRLPLTFIPSFIFCFSFLKNYADRIYETINHKCHTVSNHEVMVEKSIEFSDYHESIQKALERMNLQEAGKHKAGD